MQPTCQWLLSHVCSSPKPTKPGLVLTPGHWYDGIWWNVSVNWIKGCVIILQISLSGWWTTPNGINYKHLMRKTQNHNHLQFQCLGSHFQTLNIPRHAWGISGIACFGSSWLLVTCSNIMQYHEIGWILLIGTIAFVVLYVSIHVSHWCEFIEVQPKSPAFPKRRLHPSDYHPERSLNKDEERSVKTSMILSCLFKDIQFQYIPWN